MVESLHKKCNAAEFTETNTQVPAWEIRCNKTNAAWLHFKSRYLLCGDQHFIILSKCSEQIKNKTIALIHWSSAAYSMLQWKSIDDNCIFSDVHVTAKCWHVCLYTKSIIESINTTNRRCLYTIYKTHINMTLVHQHVYNIQPAHLYLGNKSFLWHIQQKLANKLYNSFLYKILVINICT